MEPSSPDNTKRLKALVSPAPRRRGQRKDTPQGGRHGSWIRAAQVRLPVRFVGGFHRLTGCLPGRRQSPTRCPPCRRQRRRPRSGSRAAPRSRAASEPASGSPRRQGRAGARSTEASEPRRPEQGCGAEPARESRGVADGPAAAKPPQPPAGGGAAALPEASPASPLTPPPRRTYSKTCSEVQIFMAAAAGTERERGRGRCRRHRALPPPRRSGARHCRRQPLRLRSPGGSRRRAAGRGSLASNRRPAPR